MKTVKFTFDPCRYYRHKLQQGAWQVQLSRAMGVLPMWAISGTDDESAQQTFDRCYSFGLFEIEGGKINDKGIYHFPEDPGLYPLAMMELGEEVIYFYSSAIVGIIREDGTQFVTRMD